MAALTLSDDTLHRLQAAARDRQCDPETLLRQWLGAPPSIVEQAPAPLQGPAVPVVTIFETALHASPVTITFQDSDLRYHFLYNVPPYVDPAVFIGRTDAEIITLLLEAEAQPEAERFIALKRQVLATGQPLADELALVLDNVPRYFRVQVAPLSDAAGHCRGVTTTTIEVTQQRQMAAENYRLSERFRLALHHSDMIVSCVDTNLCHTWLYIPQINFDPAHYIGHKVLATLPDQSEAVPVHAAMQRVLAGGPGERHDFTVTVAGRRLVYDTRIEPLYDGDGHISGLSVAAFNITDRKALQEALRLNEQRFRTALRHLPISVFQQDTDLRYTWFEIPMMTEADFSAMIGSPDSAMPLDADGLARLLRLKQQVLAEGQGRRETVTLDLNGIVSAYDLTLEPLLDEQQQVVGLTGAAYDISERQRLEEALWEATSHLEKRVQERTAELERQIEERRLAENDVERLMKVLEHTEDLIGIADATGSRLLFTNEALRRFLALRPGEDPFQNGKVSRALRDLLYRLAVPQALEHGSWVGEIVLEGAGRSLPASLLLLAPRNAAGEVAYLAGIARDITPQKEVERSLRANLLREQELNELRAHFVTTVSHEFRTPLAAVLASVEILERYLDRLTVERRQEHITRIKNNVAHLTQLVEKVVRVAV
ncbi:MAG: PAS domain-containing protein [Anaerolineae bacterium]|nr:PAS domain-containing protein [Anaerolineae bacterium]